MAVTSLVQEKSWTQEPPESVVIATDSLLHTSRAAKLRLVLGRLSLDPACYFKCERKASLADGRGLEFLEVTADRGLPSIHYRLESPLHQASVHVQAVDRVQIESSLKIDGRQERLKIVHSASGPIDVSHVTTEESSANYQTGPPTEVHFKSVSLTHLDLTHPTLYQNHLSPLLARLLSSPPARCDIIDLVEVLANVPETSLVEHKGVVEKVEQLKSASRAVRNSAEAELIAIGLPILAILDRLPQQDFETEQKIRLNRVRTAVLPKSNDTSQQLAIWLASDIQYWNLIAGNLSHSQRDALAARIESTTGKPLQVEIQVAGTGPRLR
jgi:hypothetical protein